MEQNDTRRTMTVEEFGEAFGIARSTAYMLAREGRLPVPVIHLGRRMVLSRKAVQDLLDAECADGEK